MKDNNLTNVIIMCTLTIIFIIGTIVILAIFSPNVKEYKIESFTDSIYYETTDNSVVINVKNIYNFKQK